MKELPLLNSNFPQFSWEATTGNATAEQLQKAYAALNNKGRTEEFSHKVWNDIVDLLNQALTKSGHTWDSKYGTLKATKITVKHANFKASQFNAVAYNIQKLINTNWKWNFDTSKLGYIGRDRFYGKSEKGNNADYLYGWYILELARMLNVFIAILKNEANFSELIHEGKVYTKDQALLLPRISAPLYFAQSALSKFNAPLLPRQSAALYIAAAAKTYENVILSPLQPGVMLSQENISTQENASVNLVALAKMGSEKNIKAEYEGTLIRRFLTRAYGRDLVTTSTNAEMTFNEGMLVRVAELSKTIHAGSLKYSQSSTLTREEITKTLHSVTFDSMTPEAMQGIADSLTKCVGEINSILSQEVEPGPQKLYTLNQGEIQPQEAEHIAANETLETSQEGTVRNSIAEHAEGYFQSLTLHAGETITREIQAIISRALSGSKGRGEAISANPIYAAGTDRSYSINEGNINLAKPQRVQSENMSESRYTASASGAVGKALTIKKKIESLVAAALSFEGVDWLEPILTGKNLYIRQAWITDQEENNLNIDYLTWLYPTQEEKNLYIKQVYDDVVVYEKNAHIDTNGIWFEPIQEGTNLYIRQAESMEGSD